MNQDRYGNWQKYHSTNPVQKALIDRFLAQLTTLIGPLPIQSILDVGCGEGFVLNMLLRMSADAKGLGVDVDHEALLRGQALFPMIPFMEADISQLPYPDRSFDLVVCTEVLEHVADPHAALAELCRVSRRYCLLSVPHEPFFSLCNLVRGKSISRLGNDRDHLQRWSQSSFTALLHPHLNLSYVRRSFPWLIACGQVR